MRDARLRCRYPLRVQKASRTPALEGGAFDVRGIARRVRDAWKASGLPAKDLVAKLGLESESGWTKRTSPDKEGWVPFRADELSILAPLLFPREPWRLFFDDTVSGIFRDALAKREIEPPTAWGRTPEPPGEPVAPPSRASPGKPAGPRRRGRGTG